eukprot:scaffold1834_cov239-Pinguiococcus_pyrenoidosus.AAC.1
MEGLRKGHCGIQGIPEEKWDVDILSQAVLCRGLHSLNFLRERADQDLLRKVLIEVLSLDGTVFHLLTEEEKHDRELAFHAISSNPRVFFGMPKDLQQDKDRYISAVRADDQMFLWPPKTLSRDTDVWLEQIYSSKRRHRAEKRDPM